MKVKTKSGVSITIIPEGPSKIMLFSKPVRAIELKEVESSQLSALLTSDFDTKANTEPKIRLMREPKAISH
jgi:hypothetical protein